MPAIATVAFEIIGFWEVLVKLFGPVQKYVPPVTLLAVRLIVPPAHTGLLLSAIGAGGIVFTVVAILLLLKTGFPGPQDGIPEVKTTLTTWLF